MAFAEWRMANGEWQLGREQIVYFGLISRVVFTNNTVYIYLLFLSQIKQYALGSYTDLK
jgi:hypothetical protein